MVAARKNSCSGWPAALAGSILFHALLLFGFTSLGWDVQTEFSRVHVVDLLAPSVSIAAIAEKPLPKRQLPQANQQDRRSPPAPRRPMEPLNEFREETIQLNTRQLKYMNYTGEVKQRIYSSWHYPEAARQQHLQGQLILEFAILESGKLAGIRVLTSSGYLPLDQGAIEAINAAKPFPPLPAHFQLDRLNIRASFLYRLVAKR
jgi:TonB family protein